MRKRFTRNTYFWISVLCLCFGFFWTYKAVRCFWKVKTDGFSVQRVSSYRKANPDWDVHPLSSEERREFDRAVSQSYHYLSCGNQAFVFLSEDGRYVLKFFKQKLFEPHRVWKWIPSTLLKEGRMAKKIWKKEDKLRRDFESYRIAFDELKEETGLVYVHLNPTHWICQKLAVIDKSGVEHRIDLDQFNFIIQCHADLVYPTIDRLSLEGNSEGAKEALLSILQLFASRCHKGIADSDPDLDKNFGFIDGRAVQIDIGRFTRNPTKVKFHERNQVKHSMAIPVAPPVIKEAFKSWLSENHPDLYIYFMDEYQKLFGEDLSE